MNPRFLPAFEAQVNDLRRRDPFSWIYEMVQAGERNILDNASQQLRADGTLFLLINIGHLIVMPWDDTEGNRFIDIHHQMLEEDTQDILRETSMVAQQRKVTDISANLLLEITATRRGGVRTRGLNLWEN
jgi:hypothetical protein